LELNKPIIMGKFTKNISVLVVLLIPILTFSQQLPQFTQYMFNTVSINPAYAGSRENLSIVGLHRSQWVGIEKGPTTQTLSAHSPLRNEKMGLGLSVINDSPGYENFIYIYSDFSYTINVNEKTKLAFGLKAGFTHYKLDQELLNEDEVIMDPFFSNISSRWNPNIGLGFYLHSNKWYVGLSAPRILNTDYNLTAQTSAIEYIALERVGYYFITGYVFDVSSNLKFKPTFLAKATNGAPLSLDFSANFLMYDKFWLGGSYRYNENSTTFGGLVDFQISDALRIGYAYETFVGGLRPYTGGTHEVLLMFELQQKTKRVKSPRYF